MSERLLIVGGGLFGSLAAAWARRHGVEAVVFDAALDGRASPASAGLFAEHWARRRYAEHYAMGLPLLETLYEIRSISLRRDDGTREPLLCVPPAVILEPAPLWQRVTQVGDGWLEVDGVRHEGNVYVAAGVWCPDLVSDVEVHARTGASFTFAGESEGRLSQRERGHPVIAFVRDPGSTYFSDGTAERDYSAEHDRQSRRRAAALGLTDVSVRKKGHRPYTPGGPVFRRVGRRLWLATGGRKMGTIVGAAFARRLVEEMG